MYRQKIIMTMPQELLTFCSILKLDGIYCYVDGLTANMAESQQELDSYNIVIEDEKMLERLSNGEIERVSKSEILFKEKSYKIAFMRLEDSHKRELLSIVDYVYDVFSQEVISNYDFTHLMTNKMIMLNNADNVFKSKPELILDCLSYMTAGLKINKLTDKCILKNSELIRDLSCDVKFSYFISMINSNPLSIKILKSYNILQYFIDNVDEFNMKMDLEVLSQQMYYYINKTEEVNPIISLSLLKGFHKEICGIPDELNSIIDNVLKIISDFSDGDFVDYNYDNFSDIEIVNAKVLGIILCYTNPELKVNIERLLKYTR